MTKRKKDFDIKINIKICSVRGCPFFMTWAYGFFYFTNFFHHVYYRPALISQIQNGGECTPWIVFLYFKYEEKIKSPKKIEMKHLPVRPLFSHLKYTAKFCIFRFYFLRNKKCGQKIWKNLWFIIVQQYTFVNFSEFLEIMWAF